MNSKKQNANKAKAEEISRKEALKKMGRYAGMTALGTFMILNPRKHKLLPQSIQVDLDSKIGLIY